MKLGRQFAEERLYSTGSDELDELLERAFCEGYEYAQREFGKAEREERRKINKTLKEHGVSSKDRRGIKRLHIIKDDPEAMSLNEDNVSEDPEKRKRVNKKVTRTSTILTTPIAATGGGLAGYSLNGKKGALIGAGIGTGVELAANTLDYHLRKKAGDSKEKREKGQDQIKVAKGKMSAEEFGKKYGKKKK